MMPNPEIRSFSFLIFKLQFLSLHPNSKMCFLGELVSQSQWAIWRTACGIERDSPRPMKWLRCSHGVSASQVSQSALTRHSLANSFCWLPNDLALVIYSTAEPRGTFFKFLSDPGYKYPTRVIYSEVLSGDIDHCAPHGLELQSKYVKKQIAKAEIAAFRAQAAAIKKIVAPFGFVGSEQL